MGRVRHSFQSICFPSEWGPLLQYEAQAIVGGHTFPINLFPQRVGTRVMQELEQLFMISVSNQFVSPASGDG